MYRMLVAVCGAFCAVFVALGVTWYCSAEEIKAAGTTTLDPCSLLSQSEITEILGKPVSEGTLNPRANPVLGPPCEFKVGDYGVCSLWIGENQQQTCEKTMAELTRQKIKTSPAPGIGDCSFFADQGYGMLQLNTWQATKYLIVTLLIPGATEDQQKTYAEQLMKIALKKL